METESRQEPPLEPEQPEQEEAPGLVRFPPPPDDPLDAFFEFGWSSDASSSTSFSPGAAQAEPVTIEERRTPLRITLARGVRDVVETVILALLIFLAVRSMVQNFRVDGSSMEGTLHDGQYVLISKATYFKVNLEFLDFLPFYESGDDPYHHIFRGPQRGDVIVFRFPNEPSRDFIKRVIAVPGETVEVRDGLVYIEGRVLREPYITQRPHYNWGPEKVPPKHYFVLGDNRNNSYDSHSWGMLPEEYIIGQAWLSYWPFSSFGLVDNSHVEPLGSNATPESPPPTPVPTEVAP